MKVWEKVNFDKALSDLELRHDFCMSNIIAGMVHSSSLVLLPDVLLRKLKLAIMQHLSALNNMSKSVKGMLVTDMVGQSLE